VDKVTRVVTLRDVKLNPYVKAYIDGGNDTTEALGYTDHGVRHA